MKFKMALTFKVDEVEEEDKQDEKQDTPHDDESSQKTPPHDDYDAKGTVVTPSPARPHAMSTRSITNWKVTLEKQLEEHLESNLTLTKRIKNTFDKNMSLEHEMIEPSYTIQKKIVCGTWKRSHSCHFD
jgi:hypothetical protein